MKKLLFSMLLFIASAGVFAHEEILSEQEQLELAMALSLSEASHYKQGDKAADERLKDVFHQWELLPDELKVEILIFLPVEDLKNLVLVERKFAQLFKDPLILREFFAKLMNDLDITKAANLLLQALQARKEYVIQAFEKSPKALKDFIKRLSKADPEKVKFMLAQAIKAHANNIVELLLNENEQLANTEVPYKKLKKVAGKYQMTYPLMLAIRKNFFDIADLLIQKGADVNGKLLKNNALIHALNNKNLTGVDFLLSHGADPNLDFTSPSIKIMQNYTGPIAILKRLLEAGAQLEQGTYDLKTLLMSAVENNNLPEVMLIIPYATKDFINKFDKEGETALIKAVKVGNAEMVKSLLDAGAEPSIKNFAQKTALDVALENKNQEIANLLLDRS